MNLAKRYHERIKNKQSVSKKLYFSVFFFLITFGVYSQIPGSLDSTFGTNGKVITSIGNYDDGAYGVAMQTDGKIIVAGFSNTTQFSNGAFVIVRYNINGTLDSTFGTSGKAITLFGSSNSMALGVALQTDGKIIAVGRTENGPWTSNFALVRYNIDGTLDSTFGTVGKIITSLGSSDDVANAVAIQNDGKIIAAGYSDNGTDYNFALVRYKSNGELDTTFGTNGKIITSVSGSYDEAYSIALQPNGKIVVAGSASNGSDNDFAVIRYNINGTLDTTFGTGGKVITSLGNYDDGALGVALQTNGKIVVAGFSNINQYGDIDFAIVQYDTTGLLDVGFGTGGIVTTPFGSNGDVARALALQTDGKIIAAGTSYVDFAAIRYNTDGTLDVNFGTGGKVTTSFAGSNGEAYAITIQTDGKIVIAGTASSSNCDFAVVRYNGGNGSVGINEQSKNDHINIFPNPATDNLTIETTDKATIEILNIAGQLIKTIRTTEKQTSIDVSDLSGGVYIIKAKTEKGVAVKKFVKE